MGYIKYFLYNKKIYNFCNICILHLYLFLMATLFEHQVCVYHFYNHLLPRTKFYDDDFLVAHRDDIFPIYETKDFLEAQQIFYECAFRLLCDSEVLARKASSSYGKNDGKGYFYI